MIIDHTHPLYSKKRLAKPDSKYTGAYYYSKEIVKNIIPNVKTDRSWVTVRLPEVQTPDHSIVFIHNNRNPNYYEYLKDVKDCIMVCSQLHTVANLSFFGTTVYLPLSVDVKSVEKYKKKNKSKEMCFAGRRCKITNHVPRNADILTDMPQGELIKAMSDYKLVYAVGRTAIQANILGCKIGVYDNMYPDPTIWDVIDNKEAAKMLQKILDEIDEVN